MGILDKLDDLVLNTGVAVSSFVDETVLAIDETIHPETARPKEAKHWPKESKKNNED